MRVRTTIVRTAATIGMVGLVGVVALTGFRLVRSDVRAEVYRRRLEGLASDYEALRQTYNDLVKRTAVTELVVKDGRLSVRVSNAAGVVREIPTPFDPSGEIYVDFVVRDGRLLIRRVFDGHTPPHAGLVIDADLAEVRWSDGWPDQPPVGAATYGKAIYRQLGEGRWVISVTGDGSLGLVRARAGENVPLVAAPSVHDYAAIEAEADRRVGEVGWRDLLMGLVDPG